MGGGRRLSPQRAARGRIAQRSRCDNRVNTAKNDALKEGEEKGLKKGKTEDIVNWMASLDLTMDQALQA